MSALDGGVARVSTVPAELPAGASMRPEWTSAELHYIATMASQMTVLIEGPPVYGDARTVALVRHVQRKAIQLAFNAVARDA